ncbi:MAG: hypothetical protein H8E38_08615 [SAR324 cluster bacterium]|nr:hypothetical protein [SAR324 cluster bacterium]
MHYNLETPFEFTERGTRHSTSEKPLSGSGVGLLLIAHLLCCGLPLLIFSGIGAGALLSWIADSVLPVAGVLLLAALAVWGGLRFRKDGQGKSCVTAEEAAFQN